MVLTIEPGCYFVDHLINEALSSEDLSRYLLTSYSSTGGNDGNYEP